MYPIFSFLNSNIYWSLYIGCIEGIQHIFKFTDLWLKRATFKPVTETTGYPSEIMSYELDGLDEWEFGIVSLGHRKWTKYVDCGSHKAFRKHFQFSSSQTHDKLVLSLPLWIFGVAILLYLDKKMWEEMYGTMNQFMISIVLPPSGMIMEACVKMKSQSALVPSDCNEQKSL